MSDVLKGNLSELAISEILRLLANGKKNGCLSITSGLEGGEVYFQDGEITHVACGIEAGEPALHEIMAWKNGSFAFNPQAISAEVTIDKVTENLLEETEAIAKELLEIRATIPNNDAVYKISTRGSSEGVSLVPDEWKVLAHINGSRGASEIAGILGMEKIDVLKILARLVSEGLLEVGQGPERITEDIIDPDFFDRLTIEFTDLLGPMASFIIDEQIEAVGRTRANFPLTKIADLIERISADIDDEQKRMQFQQIILSLLRK